ncbi:hypothetical protein LLG95_17960 [bacterium]|nr:hypothetical protein [bacterium]
MSENDKGGQGSLDPSLIFIDLIPRESLNLLLACLKEWNWTRYEDATLARLDADPRLSLIKAHIAGIRYPENSPAPLIQLFDDMITIHGATEGILEHPYLDVEWWVRHPDKPFLKHTMGCRFHFFCTEDGGKAAYETMCNSEAPLRIKPRDYLGFITFMTDADTKNYSLGRSCMRPPGKLKGADCCIKHLSSQPANVLMKSYVLDTVPYIQHVPRIPGNCATASIWTASNMLSSGFDLSLMRYNDISRLAVSTPKSKNQDLEKLDIEQIVGALNNVDAKSKIINIAAPRRLPSRPGTAGPARPPVTKSPIMQRDRFDDLHLMTAAPEAMDNLYLYVESGLPVILGTHEDITSMDGHAMTVVGHLQPSVIADDAISPAQARFDHVYSDLLKDYLALGWIEPIHLEQHYLISQFYRDYLVHDEARGPFRHIRFETDPPGDGYRCPCRIEGPIGRPPINADLHTLIVPMPPIGEASPRRILINAVTWFNLYWYREIENQPVSVLWRPFLVREIHFKQSLKFRGYPPDMIDCYRPIHLPRFVYVFEFTVIPNTDLHKSVLQGRKRPISGEFIYDTTSPYSFTLTPLAMRHDRHLINTLHRKSSAHEWFRSRYSARNITCYCGTRELDVDIRAVR